VACDDEVLLSPETTGLPRVSSRRVWPMIGGALLLAAGAGMGAKAALSFHDGESISLHSSHSSWRDRLNRFDANGCTWDGDDCRSSKCCARPGSRCYVKSSHWASCNDTCHSHVKWTGKHWKTTSHAVWECTDLSASTTASASATAELATALPEVVTVQATAPPSTYYLYDDNVNSAQVLAYPKPGDRSEPVAAAAAPASTTAAVRFFS